MHSLRLNVRLLALAAAVVALVLAAGSLAPRQTSADYTDPSGVMCGYMHTLTLNTVNIPFSGTVLSRIEFNDPDYWLTAVAYTDPGGTLTMPNCKTAQEAMPKGVVVPDVANEVRPSVTGLSFVSNKLSGTSCQEDFTFAGFPMADWSRITLQLNVSKDEPTTQSTGSFTIKNAYANETDCSNDQNPTPGLGTIVVSFNSLYLDGPDDVKGNFDSDWDKDGCLDWDELEPTGYHYFDDPFDSSDCPGVGGISVLPEVAGTALETADSSGSSTGLLIAIVTASATALVIALGGAAWYARRRRLQ